MLVFSKEIMHIVTAQRGASNTPARLTDVTCKGGSNGS